MKPKVVAVVVCTVASFACVNAAQATTRSWTLYPVADTKVDSANPTNTYGDDAFMQAFSTSTPRTMNSQLLFDARLPYGATVTSATLSVYATAAPAAGTVSVGYRIGDGTEPSERSLNWNNRLTGFTTVLSGVALSVNSYTNIDVTSALSALASAGPLFGGSFFAKSDDYIEFQVTNSSSTSATIVTKEKDIGWPPVRQMPKLAITWTRGPDDPSGTSVDSQQLLVFTGDTACSEANTRGSTSCHQQDTGFLADDVELNPADAGDRAHTNCAGAAWPMGPCQTQFFQVGDNQYQCAGPTGYSERYDPAWGTFADGTSLKDLTHPAIGNHEYLVKFATDTHGVDSLCETSQDMRSPVNYERGDGYWDYWNGAGNNTGPAGTRGQGWYSLDVNWDNSFGYDPVHVVVLNSECSYVGCGYGSAQETWLANDLAAMADDNPNNHCLIAVTHEPRFSSGPEGDNTSINPLLHDLVAYGLDVLVSGHDHDYERFSAMDETGTATTAGFRQFVVGTGGANLSPRATIHSGSEVFDGTNYGLLEIAAVSNTGATGWDLEWRFVADQSRTAALLTDSGHMGCGNS